MRRILTAARNVPLIVCACVLILAQAAAAADQNVVADFDGDGRRDNATLDQRGPSSVIRVWLSSTRAVAIIGSPTPIMGIVARDLDGDHRDELVGAATTRLKVWTLLGHGFRRVQPREAGSGLFALPNRHHTDDGAEGAPDGLVAPSPLAVALSLSWQARPPTPPHQASSARVSSRPSPLLESSAPRPPPLQR